MNKQPVYDFYYNRPFKHVSLVYLSEAQDKLTRAQLSSLQRCLKGLLGYDGPHPAGAVLVWHAAESTYDLQKVRLTKV